MLMAGEGYTSFSRLGANVLLLVPVLLGTAALFVVPGPVGAESNLALFKLVTDSPPAWAVVLVRALVFSGNDPLRGVDAGLLALVANLANPP
ncbi:hypothetical protein [Streptomyces sp. Qhu_M48]|uniref:hypothetical protein n=1 Tax=Streptomyces sp. Qhu_M48 TaxID=3435889 RepID=UPI003F4FDAEE